MILNSKTLFARKYNGVFRQIMNHEKERYTFTGGRSSCKSSFIAIVIVILIVMFPNYNALIIRRYSKNLRLSVFEQIKWAIEKLGIKGFSIPKSKLAALPITYTRRNGKQQQIIFAGLDNPEKYKSMKLANGYIAILWVEEKTELNEGDLHNVKISALRGGDVFYMFESYNPPAASRHWCNKEANTYDPNRVVIHTTYLDVPREWISAAIWHDIEQTKATNQRAYENIYLGIATGTGRNIFENVKLQAITDEEIAAFDQVRCGIDWGYYPDPYAYGAMYYDIAKETLYIFDELYLLKHGNYEAFKATSEHMKKLDMDIARDRQTADSAEPKSIADYRSWGGNTVGAIKGRGSLEAGMKWLQGLKAIIIDPVRCPHMTEEFTLYEYDLDKNTGEIMTGYPDGQPDHGIALTRYALEGIWMKRGA